MLTDEELAAQTQAGSLAAFEELVDRHETRIYQFLRARTGNDHDAADLTQTAFVTAYRAIHRFDRQRKFTPWMFTITRRVMIDHFRTTAVRAGQPAPPAADWRDPSVILAERDNHRAIWELARRTLTDNQFTALWLKYEEDLPVKHIARVMNKTGIHVKVLLHRARSRLLVALRAPESPVSAFAVAALAERGPRVAGEKAAVTAHLRGRRHSVAAQARGGNTGPSSGSCGCSEEVA